MKVPWDAVWIDPWIVLVWADSASTPPGDHSPGGSALSRSWKFVLTALKPVVCALAMLPDMFCRANDWACSPETAVASASKAPMAESSDCSNHRIGFQQDPCRDSCDANQGLM